MNVPKGGGRKNPRGDVLQIDTSDVLFICGGAFAGMEQLIERRVCRSSIGFGAPLKRPGLATCEQQGAQFEMAEPEDLVHYGLIPEFVGRLPLLVSRRGGGSGDGITSVCLKGPEYIHTGVFYVPVCMPHSIVQLSTRELTMPSCLLGLLMWMAVEHAWPDDGADGAGADRAQARPCQAVPIPLQPRGRRVSHHR